MFEFLRARVFAAGLLFAALTILPVVAISRLFGVFGLLSPAGTKTWVKPEHSAYAKTCSFAQFPVIAVVLANLVRNIFLSTPNSDAGIWWSVPSIGAIAAAMSSERALLGRFPLLVTLANVAAGLFVLFTLHKWHPNSFLVYWFFGVAVVFMFLRYYFASTERSRFDWERWGAYSLTLVFIFATVIYGRIKPAWGGGVVAPVVVHFARTTPFSSSTDTKAYLIDETDKGYYLTHDGDDRRATFIPRDAIAGIDYEELK